MARCSRRTLTCSPRTLIPAIDQALPALPRVCGSAWPGYVCRWPPLGVCARRSLGDFPASARESGSFFQRPSFVQEKPRDDGQETSNLAAPGRAGGRSGRWGNVDRRSGTGRCSGPRAERCVNPWGAGRGFGQSPQRPARICLAALPALCRQAEPGKAGVPDPNRLTIRDYDPDRSVVWETWALASGGRAGPVYVPPNESEVYLDRGETPAPWDELPRDKPQPKVFEPYVGKGLDFLLKVARAPAPSIPSRTAARAGSRCA